jgi:hypothetical protein
VVHGMRCPGASGVGLLARARARRLTFGLSMGGGRVTLGPFIKPSIGLEPMTPSLPSKFSHAEKWRLPGYLSGTSLAEMSTNSGC